MKIGSLVFFTYKPKNEPYLDNIGVILSKENSGYGDCFKIFWLGGLKGEYVGYSELFPPLSGEYEIHDP